MKLIPLEKNASSKIKDTDILALKIDFDENEFKVKKIVNSKSKKIVKTDSKNEKGVIENEEKTLEEKNDKDENKANDIENNNKIEIIKEDFSPE